LADNTGHGITTTTNRDLVSDGVKFSAVSVYVKK